MASISELAFVSPATAQAEVAAVRNRLAMTYASPLTGIPLFRCKI